MSLTLCEEHTVCEVYISIAIKKELGDKRGKRDAPEPPDACIMTAYTQVLSISPFVQLHDDALPRVRRVVDAADAALGHLELARGARPRVEHLTQRPLP